MDKLTEEAVEGDNFPLIKYIQKQPSVCYFREKNKGALIGGHLVLAQELLSYILPEDTPGWILESVNSSNHS